MTREARWAAILSATGAEEGTWVDLPANDQSVLVAYVAGPGRARAVRVAPGRSRVRVTVQHHDGSVEQSERDLSEEDIADEYTFTSSYFTDLGLPPPPGVYRWSILAPHGSTPSTVQHLIESAANGDAPLDDPVDDMIASARRVAAAVAGLLGVPNPLAQEHGEAATRAR